MFNDLQLSVATSARAPFFPWDYKLVADVACDLSAHFKLDRPLLGLHFEALDKSRVGLGQRWHDKMVHYLSGILGAFILLQIFVEPVESLRFLPFLTILIAKGLLTSCACQVFVLFTNLRIHDCVWHCLNLF